MTTALSFMAILHHRTFLFWSLLYK